MATFAELSAQVAQKHRVFWQGGVTEPKIDELEQLLQAKLPVSFRNFLVEYGGGGAVGQEISGIEDGDPANDNRGTVLGDTLRCREELALPVGLVVVYLADDLVVWCLDTLKMATDECPVVSFEAATKNTALLFPDFRTFFNDYLVRRA